MRGIFGIITNQCILKKSEGNTSKVTSQEAEASGAYAPTNLPKLTSFF